MWHKQTCVSLSVFLSEGKSVSVSKRPCCHWERWARDWHVCSNPAWSIYRINLLRYISRNRFNPSRRMRRKLSAPWCDPTDWLIEWMIVWLDRAHSAAALLGDLQKPPVSKRAPPAESRCSEYGLCVWERESEEGGMEEKGGKIFLEEIVGEFFCLWRGDDYPD